jgi:FlaA1/EpsC-like NDP-sugar epimerase
MMKVKVLIVGAGLAGKELLAEIKKHFKKTYEVVGFVDDDIQKLNKNINGVEVLGRVNSLASLVRKNDIAEVFIAIPSAKGETMRRVIAECQKEKVVFRVIPRTLEIVQGKVKLQQIREVQVEDLLGRAIVQSEQYVFENFFKEKTVLVSGAAGSIGSEICRQVAQFLPKKLIGIDCWESGIFELERELMDNNPKAKNIELVIGNIRDEEKIKYIFKKYKPDIVFHAAAYKHVPLMERHPDEAVKNNVFGTRNLAKIAFENGVSKFINISTDKAVNPTSIMGMTKLLGEYIVCHYNSLGKTKYSSVRFGNVLASQGSVVPLFKKQIAHGGPVTVTSKNMTRYFMTIPEATQLVLAATVLGKGGEIFILDMGEPIKILDLAKLVISLSGFIPDEEIKIKYIGKRPGEKMAEELSSKKELLEKTANKKIFKIKPSKISNQKLEEILYKLQKAGKELENEKIKQILKKAL